MSENGPFLWQPGVFKPIRNKWRQGHHVNTLPRVITLSTNTL